MDRKFRAKRVDNGEWVYGWYVKYIFRGSEIHYIIDEKFNLEDNYGTPLAHRGVEVLPATVGQSTGLKDKNGQEIYEQDYVMAPNGAIGLVEYQTDALNSGFVIKLIKGKDFSFDDYMGRKVGFDELEIIGNVTDSPKLLEEKNG